MGRMSICAAVCAVALIASNLLAGQEPAKMWAFRVTDPNGGVLEGTVRFQPLGPQNTGLTPQDTAIRVLGVIFMSGTGSTGSDGSVGAFWSNLGVSCTSNVQVVATPHYAGGQARFAMIGGRDAFGLTIWVGRADGLGLNGANFDFVASCAGSSNF